jgi:ABC-type antimicrobial peptide transport system permease subunit
MIDTIILAFQEAIDDDEISVSNQYSVLE